MLFQISCFQIIRRLDGELHRCAPSYARYHRMKMSRNSDFITSVFKKDYSNFPAEFVLELPIALMTFDEVL